MSDFDQFAAIVGVDWADRKHDLCLLDQTSGERTFSVLLHSPEAIERWALDLQQRYPDAKIAVCIETSGVPLVAVLMQ